MTHDMAVGFFWYQIGSGDFLHCFFSTVVNLENGSWGSRFPLIMNKLYQGSLDSENVGKALIELNTIEEELGKISPDKVVWDIDDIKKQPPWGNNISKDITDLSNYFVTSDGEDFLRSEETKWEKCLKIIFQNCKRIWWKFAWNMWKIEQRRFIFTVLLKEGCNPVISFIR